MEQNNKIKQEQTQTKYAQRPHRPEKNKDKSIKTRNILNIAFMILAVIGVASYIWIDEFIGTIIVLVAMAIKMVECVMRMIK